MSSKRRDPNRRSSKEIEFQARKEYWKCEKTVSKIHPAFTGVPYAAVMEIKGVSNGKET